MKFGIKLIGSTEINRFHTADAQLFSKDEFDKFTLDTRSLIFRGVNKQSKTNPFQIPTAYFENNKLAYN